MARLSPWIPYTLTREQFVARVARARTLAELDHTIDAWGHDYARRLWPDSPAMLDREELIATALAAVPSLPTADVVSLIVPRTLRDPRVVQALVQHPSHLRSPEAVRAIRHLLHAVYGHPAAGAATLAATTDRGRRVSLLALLGEMQAPAPVGDPAATPTTVTSRRSRRGPR